ncbi:hypothetical protein LK10_15930 [Sinomonas humi]|uniref:Uncharacterized protein n=1 Tax=Sinomonas humi TaxID=1338436 RepID=A0A0B2AI15_9MICC|nr:hypothetical protein LK10_15930 [Sinomonas humi]
MEQLVVAGNRQWRGLLEIGDRGVGPVYAVEGKNRPVFPFVVEGLTRTHRAVRGQGPSMVGEPFARRIVPCPAPRSDNVFSLHRASPLLGLSDMRIRRLPNT